LREDSEPGRAEDGGRQAGTVQAAGSGSGAGGGVPPPRGTESMSDIVQRVRGLLATRLKLAGAADELGDETPLFGPGGLELDSIDALELVLGLEKEFGVVIEDRATAVQVLASIRTIAEFVESQGKG